MCPAIGGAFDKDILVTQRARDENLVSLPLQTSLVVEPVELIGLHDEVPGIDELAGVAPRRAFVGIGGYTHSERLGCGRTSL